MEKKTKAATQTGIYLLVVAAILVVVNLLSIKNFKRIDTTANERFTLSKGSARLVSEGLNKQLEMDVYVTRGLPKYDQFVDDLTDLLNSYERASGGKLRYTLIEPKSEDEKKAAAEAGLQEFAFGEGSKTGKQQAVIGKGYMGIALRYGSEKDSIPVLTPEQSMGLEFWISNKIREIRDRADERYVKLGVITGKDEIKLTEQNLVANQGGRGPSMKGIFDQALPFYKIEDVDLQNGEAEINPELAGLIVTQPGKEYTEKELRRIDQFLMRGNKAVAIIASAVNVKAADAGMKAELNTRGLEKLLDGYGVEMKKDAIIDLGRPGILQLQTQGRVIVLMHPGVVDAQYDQRLGDKEQMLDQSFLGFFRMPELAFPFASTLVPHAEKQPGASLKVVARTSPKAGSATGDNYDMAIQSFPPIAQDWKPPAGEGGQRAIAIALEGKIKSAFAGKEGDGITGVPAESKDKSRLLVISSAQFLANPLARAGNAPPMPPQMMMMGQMGGDKDLQMLSQPYAQQYLTNTILAFKNTLDWMSGDSDLIAASVKLTGDSNLTYSDIQKSKDAALDPAAAKQYEEEITKVQQRVQWTLILGPAVFFALVGFLFWYLRERARSAITLD